MPTITQQSELRGSKLMPPKKPMCFPRVGIAMAMAKGHGSASCHLRNLGLKAAVFRPQGLGAAIIFRTAYAASTR